MIPCRRALCVVVALGFCPLAAPRAQSPAAPTQTSEPPSGTVADDIAEIDRGNWAYVGTLVSHAGATAAIPILEDRLPKSSDPEMKARIASELWKIGDRKPIYLDYLLKLASVAVESPNPWKTDANGKMELKEDKPQFAPEFISWAHEHGFADPPVAATYTLPGYLLMAAETGDWQTDAIFRRGIASPSLLIVTMSAMGLAKLQDTDAIPLLISTCESRPDAAPVIAFESLIFFDDPRAEAAARKYLPPYLLKIFGNKKLFAGTDPFNGKFPDTPAPAQP